MTSLVPVPEAASELRGKRLLVVLGSYKSKRHIYEQARSLGVRLVVLDGPGHWISEGADQGDPLVEPRLIVDLAPFESFVDRALTAVREAGLSFDGIGTIDEFGGGFAARIAERLGLPFHATAATDRARNKFAAREACAAAGVAGPRFALIEAEDDLLQAARGVGFPAVLKPCSGVGSEQTYRIESEEDLARRYAQIVGRVRTYRHPNQPGLSSDRNWFDLMWANPPRLILESWIGGPKFDVDVLLDDGEVVYGHAIDDLDPCGLRDVRRVAPSGLDAASEKELVEHAAVCVRALGFSRGAFNVEVKRTTKGPRMIEVNGRLGGYSTTDVHLAVWGVDLVEQWLRSALGLPLTARDRPPACFVAESLLPSPRTGVVERDGFLDHLRLRPTVLAARPWVFAGDRVMGIETGAPDWLGALLTRGSTREEALAELDRLLSGLVFPVTSRPESA